MMEFPKDVELNELGVPKEVFYVHGRQVIRCVFKGSTTSGFIDGPAYQYNEPNELGVILYLSFMYTNPPIFLREKDAAGYIEYTTAVDSLVKFLPKYKQ